MTLPAERAEQTDVEQEVHAPSLAVGLVKLARPKQWTKNLLVFAAPGAGGVLTTREPALDALTAFVCFCLAAAGTYYVNDARDVHADRLHPDKRRRPVAAGVVPVPLATTVGVALMASAVALSFVANARLALTVAGYIIITTAYSIWLKHIPVIDLVAIASGFVLRAVAGAAATGVPISNWFFIIAIFGSLFMVSGKRGAEAAEMGDGAGGFRSVLSSYSDSYLAYLRTVTSGAVMVGYCIWAVEKVEEVGLPVTQHPWFQISILPFLVGVLRYALVLDQGKGSAPEEILFNDRMLQLVGVAWILVFAMGVYTE
jgi:decaprenyl-phosphate phosphoribosyltransferase